MKAFPLLLVCLVVSIVHGTYAAGTLPPLPDMPRPYPPGANSPILPAHACTPNTNVPEPDLFNLEGSTTAMAYPPAAAPAQHTLQNAASAQAIAHCIITRRYFPLRRTLHAQQNLSALQITPANQTMLLASSTPALTQSQKP
jgi:hypothetical protein